MGNGFLMKRLTEKTNSDPQTARAPYGSESTFRLPIYLSSDLPTVCWDQILVSSVVWLAIQASNLPRFLGYQSFVM